LDLIPEACPAIQHNGLVKIGSVAPDAIHKNVKTFRENIKNFHFLAPEWAALVKKLNLSRTSSFSRFLTTTLEDSISLTPAIDIFAFGMCALETAALELAPSSGEAGGGGQITQEAIEKSIDSLEDEMQKDFIRKCLNRDPLSRPNARDLLLHPVLFEVHSLKLLAAHTLVKNPASSTESITEEAIHRYYGNNTVLASINITVDGVSEEKQFKLADFPVHEKLEKFMEDVKFGIYPLTAFAMATPTPSIERPPSPESQQVDASSEQEKQDVENRRILNMQCSIQESGVKKEKAGEVGQLSLRILLRFEDKMNRQLSCMIDNQVDSPVKLAEELVQHGFIHPLDSGAIQEMLDAAITKYNSCEPSDMSHQFEGAAQ